MSDRIETFHRVVEGVSIEASEDINFVVDGDAAVISTIELRAVHCEPNLGPWIVSLDDVRSRTIRPAADYKHDFIGNPWTRIGV